MFAMVISSGVDIRGMPGGKCLVMMCPEGRNVEKPGCGWIRRERGQPGGQRAAPGRVVVMDISCGHDAVWQCWGPTWRCATAVMGINSLRIWLGGSRVAVLQSPELPGRLLASAALWAYYNCDSSTIRLQHATRCVRFERDSSTIQHPTRSYVLSSNNEHVNSFALL